MTCSPKKSFAVTDRCDNGEDDKKRLVFVETGIWSLRRTNRVDVNDWLDDETLMSGPHVRSRRATAAVATDLFDKRNLVLSSAERLIIFDGKTSCLGNYAREGCLKQGLSGSRMIFDETPTHNTPSVAV